MNPKETYSAMIKTEAKRLGFLSCGALAQAQVARICQYQNYNYDKAEVIPWTPEEIT